MSTQTLTPSSRKRDASLDVLKGLGILLVVIGHIFEPPISKLIYTFHMPLFFFVGGYLTRTQANPLEFSIRKASQLLTPYVVFLVLLLGTQTLIVLLNTGQVPPIVFSQYIYGGEKLVGWFSVFWFPTCYFFTVCLYSFLNANCSSKTIWSLVVVMLALASVSQYLVPGFSLPLAANVVLVSLPLFHFGAQYRAHEMTIDQSLAFKAIIAVVAIAYLCSVLFLDAPVMAMKRAGYGWPGFTLLASIACTISILYISRMITARSTIFTQMFAYCGTASLTVMYLHQPIHFILKNEVSLYNVYALATISILVPLLAHALFMRSALSRRLLLGLRNGLKNPMTRDFREGKAVNGPEQVLGELSNAVR